MDTPPIAGRLAEVDDAVAPDPRGGHAAPARLLNHADGYAPRRALQIELVTNIAAAGELRERQLAAIVRLLRQAVEARRVA